MTIDDKAIETMINSLRIMCHAQSVIADRLEAQTNVLIMIEVVLIINTVLSAYYLFI